MLETILLIAFALFTPEKKVDVRLLEHEGRTAAVITLDDTLGAEDANVRIFYWVKVKGISQPLVLSEVFEVPVLKGISTMSGDVPARKADIYGVKVTLVRRIAQHEVKFTTTAPH